MDYASGNEVGAANIRLHGDYGVGPKELFGELGKYGLLHPSHLALGG